MTWITDDEIKASALRGLERGSNSNSTSRVSTLFTRAVKDSKMPTGDILSKTGMQRNDLIDLTLGMFPSKQAFELIQELKIDLPIEQDELLQALLEDMSGHLLILTRK